MRSVGNVSEYFLRDPGECFSSLVKIVTDWKYLLVFAVDLVYYLWPSHSLRLFTKIQVHRARRCSHPSARCGDQGLPLQADQASSLASNGKTV